MDFYGHSGSNAARDDWQMLADHLTSVATLAAEFAGKTGLERSAYIAGLFHDLGKYDPAFQAYIAGLGASVDHSTAGAQVLCQFAKGNDKAMAEIIAYAILGHHAGLPDRLNETNGCFEARMKKPLRVDSAWERELGQHLATWIDGIASALPPRQDKDLQRYAFTLSFLGRFLFSCLVDADFKDTEEFYASLGQRAADRHWPSLGNMLDEFIGRFEVHMAQFSGKPAASESSRALNHLRTEILAHVRTSAAKKPGFFTLTVPTGGGKTLASLGFALDHAKLHGNQRIIYAIPSPRSSTRPRPYFAACWGKSMCWSTIPISMRKGSMRGNSATS